MPEQIGEHTPYGFQQFLYCGSWDADKVCDQLRGYLCCYKENIPLSDLVRMAGTRWTVKMCFAETKGDIGFDHYEVRSWQGWYRHITLAMCTRALVSVLKAELLDMGTVSFFSTGKSGGSLDAFRKRNRV